MVKFKFEKWNIDGEGTTLHFVGIDGDCPALKLPMLVAGSIWEGDVRNINELELEEIDDNIIGVFLSEFHSDPVAWEDWNDEYMKYYPIKKCPISGEDLVIEIIAEIDKTDEYLETKVFREQVHNEWKNTDSIKEKARLENERRELDDKINELITDSLYQFVEEDEEEEY